MGTNTAAISSKSETALMLLRDEIDAIKENPARLARYGASIADFRGIMHFYVESLGPRRSNESSIFITGAMRAMLEEAGFTMTIHCGLYFVNWNA